MRSGGRICPRQDMSKNRGKWTDGPECVPGLDTLWKRVQYLVFFGRVKGAGTGVDKSGTEHPQQGGMAVNYFTSNFLALQNTQFLQLPQIT